MAQTPQHGDSEHNLLLKIADNFGVAANYGDSKNSILYKIANTTYQTAINPPSPSYDPDALAYVQASGATDIDNINTFVVGIKALGLWNSMVCWPLRSTQNAGTGSTAYSLGGLGTYNGTLVNGPTWGADGVVAATNNSYIQTAISITLSTIGEFSVVGVGNIPSGSNRRLIGSNGFTTILSTTASNNYGYVLFDNINFNIPITNNFNNTITHWANVTKNSNLTFEGRINAGLTKTTTFTSIRSSPDNLAFFGSSGSSQGGVYPFFAYANIKISPQQDFSFYNLYKLTLGQGLGLP
jgi:hypothetical protein